jgi:hypothetical protein
MINYLYFLFLSCFLRLVLFHVDQEMDWQDQFRTHVGEFFLFIRFLQKSTMITISIKLVQ